MPYLGPIHPPGHLPVRPPLGASPEGQARRQRVAPVSIHGKSSGERARPYAMYTKSLVCLKCVPERYAAHPIWNMYWDLYKETITPLKV